MQSGSLCTKHLCIKRTHFRCELLLGKGIDNGFCNDILRLCHCSCFRLNDCLTLLCSSSGCKGSIECGNLCHSGISETGIGKTLLLCINNRLLLLFNNDLLLSGCLCAKHLCMESIHFVLKTNLLSGLAGIIIIHFRSSHCSCFGLQDDLLLLRSLSGSESGIECGNLCHSGISETGIGKTLLLCINNCLLLLFYNELLLCRSLSGKHFGIESIHLSFKCELFSGLAGGICHLGLCHCLLFSGNNSLLCFKSLCGSESGVKCCYLCGYFAVSCILRGNTLLLCLNNGLLLLFNNRFLLVGSLSSGKSSIKLVHIFFELCLLCGLYGLRCLCGRALFGRSSHGLLFCKDNGLLFFGSSCSSESGIKGSDFCLNTFQLCGVGKTLLLCLNNGLLLLFDNFLLLFGALSSNQSGIELSHFLFELLLSRSLLCSAGGRTYHSLLFGTDNGILCLRSFCCRISGVEIRDFIFELFFSNTVFSTALLLCLNNGLFFCFDNSILLCGGLSSLELGAERVHFGLQFLLILGKNGGHLGLEHSLLLGLDDSVLFLGSLSSGKGSVEFQNLVFDGFGRTCLGQTLLLFLDDGLLLNLENCLLFVLALSRLQRSVESLHVRLELHLIFGLYVCLSGLQHCCLFGFNDCLLLLGGSCTLHCGAEFRDFSICYAGSDRVGSQEFFLGFNNFLLFFCRRCSCKSSSEGSNFSGKLFLALFAGKRTALLGSSCFLNFVGNGSRCSQSFLLLCNLRLLFAFNLYFCFSFSKRFFEIFSFFGSLSSILCHIECHNFGLKSCYLFGALVGFLFQLCRFLVSLLLFLGICCHL